MVLLNNSHHLASGVKRTSAKDWGTNCRNSLGDRLGEQEGHRYLDNSRIVTTQSSVSDHNKNRMMGKKYSKSTFTPFRKAAPYEAAVSLPSPMSNVDPRVQKSLSVLIT